MELDGYLATMRQRFDSAGYTLTQDTIGGYRSWVVAPGPASGSSSSKSKAPVLAVVTPRAASTLSRTSLEGSLLAYQVAAGERRGRWGVETDAQSGGLFPMMIVVVTKGATPDARAWARSRHGVAYPVLLDVADGSVVRWRRGLSRPAGARAYRKMLNDVLIPALNG